MVLNNYAMVEAVATNPNASIDEAIKTAEASIQEAIEMYNLANG